MLNICTTFFKKNVLQRQLLEKNLSKPCWKGGEYELRPDHSNIRQHTFILRSFQIKRNWSSQYIPWINVVNPASRGRFSNIWKQAVRVLEEKVVLHELLRDLTEKNETVLSTSSLFGPTRMKLQKLSILICQNKKEIMNTVSFFSVRSRIYVYLLIFFCFWTPLPTLLFGQPNPLKLKI